MTIRDQYIIDVNRPELYADLCDIFERLLSSISPDSPHKHTSPESRAAALKVLDAVREHGIIYDSDWES